MSMVVSLDQVWEVYSVRARAWFRATVTGLTADSATLHGRSTWSRAGLCQAARRVGAKVGVADLNLRSYEEFEAEAKDMTADSTVAEIEAAGGTGLGIEVDVRDHAAVEAMVARVVQEWGRVDVLVANAGGGRGRPMDTKASSLDPALLQLVTEMNLFGTVYSCNAVAPIMKQQRSGKIITVSPVAGTAPSADGGYAHYGAAKAAIATTPGISRKILGLSGSRLTV